MLQARMKRAVPWLAIVLVLMATAYLLRSQGRLWWRPCNHLCLWSGRAWSSDNSQQLFGSFTFTHVLHGFLFCGLLTLVLPRLSALWRLSIAVSMEALWEVAENSEFIIRRYREWTVAHGYNGDTIVNSFGDILACGLGFVLARQLGFRRALAVFMLTEVTLAFWIRDSLLLNVLMLIYPIDAIKHWQAARH
jgi:Protein of unknown function (DUF2585)